MSKGFKDRLGLYTERITSVDPVPFFEQFKERIEKETKTAINYAGLDKNPKFINLFSNPRFMKMVFRETRLIWKLFHHKINFPSLLIVITLIAHDHFNNTKFFDKLIALYKDARKKAQNVDERTASIMFENELSKAAESYKNGFLFKCFIDTKGSEYHILDLSDDNLSKIFD